MSWKCEYSGKKPQVGHKVVRRGKAKKAGGIGQNVTGISKRRWYPNLQSVRVIDENGTVRRVRVCARYLKAGKFTKAPRGLHKMYLQEQARKAKAAQPQS
ncbi:MAG TPA: 50S ribosomal protein L28 [Candidatus Hydrogenedentes bacterium]|nr:50S ribosomal protein L28 [Candidatus Hydrogenedentota bacterium]